MTRVVQGRLAGIFFMSRIAPLGSMSRKAMTAPMGSSPSKMGDAVNATGNTEPSARSNVVSSLRTVARMSIDRSAGAARKLGAGMVPDDRDTLDPKMSKKV